MKRKAGDMSENFSPKKKRPRISFTKDQLRELHQIFTVQPYPDLLMREAIAHRLDLTPTNVHVRYPHLFMKLCALSTTDFFKIISHIICFIIFPIELVSE